MTLMEKLMKKYGIGYTQGTFDLFHIGHLNLINHAKECCDHLIVGVNSDELVRSYKNKTPVIAAEERAEIVRNIKAVDECYIVTTLDKLQALERYHFEAIFIGDDWKGDPRWKQTEDGELIELDLLMGCPAGNTVPDCIDDVFGDIQKLLT